MNYHILEKIEQKMYIHLNSQQQKALHDVLVECLNEEEEKNNENDSLNLIKLFLAAKRVEGCSEKTIRYYDSTIRNILKAINKEVKQVKTRLHLILNEYKKDL